MLWLNIDAEYEGFDWRTYTEQMKEHADALRALLDEYEYEYKDIDTDSYEYHMWYNEVLHEIGNADTLYESIIEEYESATDSYIAHEQAAQDFLSAYEDCQHYFNLIWDKLHM